MPYTVGGLVTGKAVAIATALPGRAWMVAASTTSTLPAQAITYNHRSEAMYRAIAKEPSNPYVLKSLRRAWRTSGFCQARLPFKSGKFYAQCTMRTTMGQQRHGHLCSMLPKTSWFSGSRKPLRLVLPRGTPNTSRFWSVSFSRTSRAWQPLGTDLWISSRSPPCSTTISTVIRSNQQCVHGATATWTSRISSSTTGRV